MEAVDTVEKEILGSEIKQTPVSIETVPPKESSEITKLRKQLGLPEVSPLLQSKDKFKQEKARLIKAYIEGREDEIFLQDKRGFIDRDKERFEENHRLSREAQRPPKNLVDQLNRFATVGFLKLRGVENAEEKVSSIEQFYNLYSKLRDGQVVDGLKKVQDLDLAINRIERIGYGFGVSYLRSEDFANSLHVLESLPEERFEDIASQLNKYFFLRKSINFVDYTEGYNKPSLTPDFVAVASIFKNGGLTPAQKEQLEQAYQFAVLTEYIPLTKASGHMWVLETQYGVPFDIVVNQFLDSDRAQDLLSVAQDAVFRDTKITPAFFENADMFYSEGQTHILKDLKELSDSDWNCKDIYDRWARGNRYRREVAEDIGSINRARDFNSDPEKMEWAALFEELSGSRALAVGSIDKYEQIYEQRKALSGLAILAKTLDVDFKKMVDYQDWDGKFGIQNRYVGGLLRGLLLNSGLDKVPPEEKDFWEYIAINFPNPGNYSDWVVEDENLEFLGHLIREKDNFNQLFEYVGREGGPKGFFRPRSRFIEKILLGETPRLGELMKRGYIYMCADVVGIDPSITLSHLDEFKLDQQIEIISNLSDEYLNRLSKEEGELYRFLRDRLNQDSGFSIKFILDNKTRFGDWVKSGVIQPQFLYDYFQNGALSTDFLTDEILGSLPEKERKFWSFFKEKNNDIRRFVLDKVKNGARTPYFSGSEDFNEKAVLQDFIREIRARPENCRTYDSLADLFRDLQREHPKGDELGLLYLKIAAAHRLRTIGDVRTEVERIRELKEVFAGLYHGNMTPFEKLSWEVLRHQLPFSADQNSQENMRNQAVVVEELNPEKLSWVHQSVHNYASVFEVAYLKSFKTFLETGKKTGLESFRNMFAGEARVPDYTEEDRQTFLSLNVVPELDKLIDFAGSFYGINLQNVQRLMSAEVFAPYVGKDDTLWKLLKELIEKDLPGLNQSLSIPSEEGKQYAVHFSFNVNKLRHQVSRVLEGVEGGENSFITSTLVADGLLDDLSKNVFTKYKDYLEQNKEKLTTNEVLESVAILGQVMTAAYYNGEVSEETFRKARIFLQFAYPESVTPQFFQVARLLFPVLRQEIDSYWEKFTGAGAPEMVEMLTRTGLSREEAEQRVYFTDLVDFKKTSMVFVLEPMMNLVEENLTRIALNYQTRIPDVGEVYARTTGENASSGDYTNSEVTSFINTIVNKEMPGDITGATRFLGELAKRPEAQAEKIARAVVSGYMDVEKLQTFQHTVIKNGETIEFFPFSFYSVDMVVILENGLRVPNPKEFILQNFSVPKVIVNSLREGD